MKIGGVCGAIFAAAGHTGLQRDCNAYPLNENNERCPVGEARITGSYNLKNNCAHIIHAVGPDARIIKDTNEQRWLLRGAYTESLKLATAHNLKSIAFPFISSAIYAVDHNLASEAAIAACREYAVSQATTLEEIRFVLFSEADYKLFQSKLTGNKPPKPDTAKTSSSQEEPVSLVQGMRLPFMLGGLCIGAGMVYYFF